MTAWGMTAMGMVFLAARVLRTPNEQWDLPPYDALRIEYPTEPVRPIPGLNRIGQAWGSDPTTIPS